MTGVKMQNVFNEVFISTIEKAIDDYDEIEHQSDHNKLKSIVAGFEKQREFELQYPIQSRIELPKKRIKMYRGFKTYRHYINYQLHALSSVICGNDEVIDSELAQRGLSSVKDLSLQDAKHLVKEFTIIAKNVSNNVNKLREVIGQGKMTDRQRAAIIKIAKYKLNWSSEALFSYILDTCPNYRSRISKWEIENSKLNHLFFLLSTKDADKIIKRLDKIQQRDALDSVNSPQPPIGD